MMPHRINKSAFEEDWNRRHENVRYKGLRWVDMPGAEPILKKLNWVLWRRDMYVDFEDDKPPGKWVAKMANRGRKRTRELSLARLQEEAEAVTNGGGGYDFDTNQGDAAEDQGEVRPLAGC